MFYIYDNYNEEWIPIGFAYFEDADKEMQILIRSRQEKNLPYDFDIYEKIT